MLVNYLLVLMNAVGTESVKKEFVCATKDIWEMIAVLFLLSTAQSTKKGKLFVTKVGPENFAKKKNAKKIVEKTIQENVWMELAIVKMALQAKAANLRLANSTVIFPEFAKTENVFVKKAFTELYAKTEK